MSIVFEIIFFVLILASFGLAYMGSKSWRVYQVVLAWFVFAAALTFSYLAVRTLKTHASWKSAAKAWQEAVRQTEQENEALRLGSELPEVDAEGKPKRSPGIEQLRHELHQLAIIRGSAWFDVACDKVDPANNYCLLTIEKPDPHEIPQKMVLFAFAQDKIEEGGGYLGEFRVTRAAPKNKSIEIAPNEILDEAQWERLRKSAGKRWTLYATMPTDDAKLYASLSDAERQALLPKKKGEDLAEFARADRPLRDYEYLFHRISMECELLDDVMTKMDGNIERVTSAIEKADKEIDYRKTEGTNLSADLEKLRYERKVVTAYAQTLRDKYTAVRSDLKTTLANTLQLGRQFVEVQLKAAEEINRRTGEQARLGN